METKISKKVNFYKNKKAFKTYDIDINKALVSTEEPYGSKSQFNIWLDIMTMMTLKLCA